MGLDFIDCFDEHDQLSVLETLLALSGPDLWPVPYERIAEKARLAPSLAFLALQLLEGHGLVYSTIDDGDVFWSIIDKDAAEQATDAANALIGERDGMSQDRLLEVQTRREAALQAQAEAEERRQRALRAPRGRPSLLAERAA
jgi:E3 ubiquitin-protein ligase DOA10